MVFLGYPPSFSESFGNARFVRRGAGFGIFGRLRFLARFRPFFGEARPGCVHGPDARAEVAGTQFGVGRLCPRSERRAPARVERRGVVGSRVERQNVLHVPVRIPGHLACGFLEPRTDPAIPVRRMLPDHLRPRGPESRVPGVPLGSLRALSHPVVPCPLGDPQRTSISSLLIGGAQQMWPVTTHSSAARSMARPASLRSERQRRIPTLLQGSL